MANARRPAFRLSLIAAAALILYLPGLGRPALWEPDEGRYGEIAREMYLSADYVTPRDNYVRYFEKPPLVYWTEAAAISIFGVNEFAVRLPAAVFSAALDPALAFCMTAALGAFYLAARSNDFRSREGRRWFLVSAAMLALGTLAKGPVAPVLCGAIALSWLLLERRGH